MIKVKERGGARIGMASATWPFATLTVTKDKLQLNATILGNFVFKPSDIVSIEPRGGFSYGLKIKHRVSNYNDNVIFMTVTSPTLLLKKIERTGFLENTDPIESDFEEQTDSLQSKGGSPIKISAAIVIVVIWNIFFLLDFLNIIGDEKNDPIPSLGSRLALGFILSTCILLLTLEPVRRLILKEGRSVNEIKKFIFFIMIISGSMFLMSIFLQ